MIDRVLDVLWINSVRVAFAVLSRIPRTAGSPMTCEWCKRKFKDNELVLPVFRYVVNETRGDFVPSQPVSYIHLSHLTGVPS